MSKTMKQWTREISEEALEVLQDHFGDRVVVKREGGQYGSTHCTIKFQFAKVTEEGAMTAERKAFENYAARHGLDPDDFGREFRTYRGGTYRITGLNTRARKYPIQAEHVGTGKMYKFPAQQVKDALARTNGKG